MLTSWSFRSGSGVSHPGVALGIREAGKGGCQAPQESLSGASPRTAPTHCGSEKPKAGDGSSRAAGGGRRADGSRLLRLSHDFGDTSDKMRTEHLAGTDQPRAREKDAVGSQGGSVSGQTEAEHRKQSEACARHPRAPRPGDRSWPRARFLYRQRGIQYLFCAVLVFYKKRDGAPSSPTPDFLGLSRRGVRPGLRAQVLCPSAGACSAEDEDNGTG